MKNKIGLLFFCAYLLQYWMQIDWGVIDKWQSIETYKMWSGFALFLVILIQWGQSLIRLVFKPFEKRKNRILNFHVWTGVFSPVVYFFHSTAPSHGLLFFLFCTFFANLFIGSLPMNKTKVNKPVLYFLLLLGHIICSALILVLGTVHIWLVFYYE